MIRTRREIERILERRANAMAFRERQAHALETEPVVTFTQAGYTLGVSLGSVAYVGEIQQLSEIPGAPPYLVGAIVSRGRVVSLLDLSLFLPLKRAGGGDITASVTIFTRAASSRWQPEELMGVEDIPRDGFVKASGFPDPIPTLATLGSRDVLILDVPRLFQDRRLGTAD